MGMALMMRMKKEKSMFRRAMLDMVRNKGETLILSSGYLDPEILDDEFVNAIVEGEPDRVIVIGGKFADKCNCSSNGNDICWYCRFTSFVEKLEEKIENSCSIFDDDFIKVQSYNVFDRTKREHYHPNMGIINIGEQYHAKVAIKRRDKKTVAAILGSSNLTKPALTDYSFGGGYFNYESDVYMWMDIPEYEMNIVFDDNDPFAFLEVSPEKVEVEPLLEDLYLQVRNSVKRKK